MTRSRGRSPRGERLVAPVPCGHRQTSTLIHAIDHQGTRAALLLEGSTNTEVFETFVEQILVPELKGNEIIILDNLSSHKGEKVNEMITATGVELRLLPPYSPDLNPIEKIFSKLKSYLRAVGARTQKGLWNTVCNALKTIQPSDYKTASPLVDTPLRNLQNRSSTTVGFDSYSTEFCVSVTRSLQFPQGIAPLTKSRFSRSNKMSNCSTS